MRKLSFSGLSGTSVTSCCLRRVVAVQQVSKAASGRLRISSCIVNALSSIAAGCVQKLFGISYGNVSDRTCYQYIMRVVRVWPATAALVALVVVPVYACNLCC